MNDISGQIITDIKCLLFDSGKCKTPFSFETWAGDGHSFIVKDVDGQEYRITVIREEL